LGDPPKFILPKWRHDGQATSNHPPPLSASNCVYPSPQEAKKTTKKKNTISLPGLPKKWVFIQLQLPNILCKPALTINGKKHPLFYLQLLCLAANFSKKTSFNTTCV